MSALGHERTSRHVRVMSAITPTADILSAGGTSAKCQKQTWLGYRDGKLSANIRVLVSIDSDPELHRRVRRISARKTHAASGTGPDLLERN